MLRYFIYLVVGIAVGFALIQLGKLDTANYVKIYLAGYVVEMSVQALLVSLLVLTLLSYALIRLTKLIIDSPFLISRWRARRSIQLADADLGSGYLALIKGDWQSAEKRLTAHADDSPIPYVSYLAAAQAAQEQGKFAERDSYLSKAYKAAPQERFAIGLAKARLHQMAGQWNMARATLEDVEPLGKNNAQFTAMLMQCHQHAEDWREADLLLARAKKQTALPAETLEQIEHHVIEHRLRTSPDMDTAWKSLTKAQRLVPANLLTYIEYLQSKDRHTEAEKLIVAGMKHAWQDDLIAAYGKLDPKSAKKSRRVVEGWLLAQPDHALANYAAGRFAMLEGEHDLAKQYLQSAINQGQVPAAYQLLGEMFEAQDNTKAIKLYKAGLTQQAQTESGGLSKPALEEPGA